MKCIFLNPQVIDKKKYETTKYTKVFTKKHKDFILPV